MPFSSANFLAKGDTNILPLEVEAELEDWDFSSLRSVEMTLSFFLDSVSFCGSVSKGAEPVEALKFLAMLEMQLNY